MYLDIAVLNNIVLKDCFEFKALNKINDWLLFREICMEIFYKQFKAFRLIQIKLKRVNR